MRARGHVHGCRGSSTVGRDAGKLVRVSGDDGRRAPRLVDPDESPGDRLLPARYIHEYAGVGNSEVGASGGGGENAITNDDRRAGGLLSPQIEGDSVQGLLSGKNDVAARHVARSDPSLKNMFPASARDVEKGNDVLPLFVHGEEHRSTVGKKLRPAMMNFSPRRVGTGEGLALPAVDLHLHEPALELGEENRAVGAPGTAARGPRGAQRARSGRPREGDGGDRSTFSVEADRVTVWGEEGHVGVLGACNGANLGRFEVAKVQALSFLPPAQIDNAPAVARNGERR